MSTPDEYRHFAEECLRWADKAQTEEEKKAFLDMAQTCIKAAATLTNAQAGPDAMIKPPGDADPEPLQ
jgi:hypothetical protein